MDVQKLVWTLRGSGQRTFDQRGSTNGVLSKGGPTPKGVWLKGGPAQRGSSPKGVRSKGGPKPKGVQAKRGSDQKGVQIKVGQVWNNSVLSKSIVPFGGPPPTPNHKSYVLDICISKWFGVADLPPKDPLFPKGPVFP